MKDDGACDEEYYYGCPAVTAVLLANHLVDLGAFGRRWQAHEEGGEDEGDEEHAPHPEDGGSDMEEEDEFQKHVVTFLSDLRRWAILTFES